MPVDDELASAGVRALEGQLRDARASPIQLLPLLVSWAFPAWWESGIREHATGNTLDQGQSSTNTSWTKEN